MKVTASCAASRPHARGKEGRPRIHRHLLLYWILKNKSWKSAAIPTLYERARLELDRFGVERLGRKIAFPRARIEALVDGA